MDLKHVYVNEHLPSALLNSLPERHGINADGLIVGKKFAVARLTLTEPTPPSAVPSYGYLSTGDCTTTRSTASQYSPSTISSRLSSLSPQPETAARFTPDLAFGPHQADTVLTTPTLSTPSDASSLDTSTSSIASPSDTSITQHSPSLPGLKGQISTLAAIITAQPVIPSTGPAPPLASDGHAGVNDCATPGTTIPSQNSLSSIPRTLSSPDSASHFAGDWNDDRDGIAKPATTNSLSSSGGSSPKRQKLTYSNTVHILATIDLTYSSSPTPSSTLVATISTWLADALLTKSLDRLNLGGWLNDSIINALAASVWATPV
ncbi:hypothetical protein F4814DRAFT_265185 [Daldinia grandis]|nr:hypothetical protein F4814DRAFT_265185 [Daldinia grandis]